MFTCRLAHIIPIIESVFYTMSTTSTGSCKTVLAGSIAKELLAEVTTGLQTLDRPPRLHGFLANQDPAARMYADWTAKTCKEKYVTEDFAI